MDLHTPFISKSFLRATLAREYEAFCDSPAESALRERLVRWASRADLGETSAEAAFLDEFFRQTWGYVQSGQEGGEEAYSLLPRFPVAGATLRGGQGIADAALGYFPTERRIHVPQVLCEFKGIRNRSLDAPQNRKNDNRSPVEQGLGYLAATRRGMFGSEPILPTWAIITDMNEFRLYWADRGERQSLRFAISPRDLFQGTSLLGEGEEVRFDRFLFYYIFQREMLTVQADTGRSRLVFLIEQQRFQQRELENNYYSEYRLLREHLYKTLLEHNAEGTARFPGTRGRLVRLAQKILDRCIFIFFCEDMGGALNFPPQLLRNLLVIRSNDPYFDPEGGEIWNQIVRLFRAMNDGSVFGAETINRFNGGLFATDTDLEQLHLPNHIFCKQGQGQNDASLHRHPLTFLYLSAAYNYASGWSGGMTGAVGAQGSDPTGEMRNVGLYTLGRIFEQSITELEILEADAEGRVSLNRESRRKRDGVYYTPEWVVERIVAETIGSRLADIKAQCGWPAPGTPDLPDEPAIRAYDTALREIKVVDPACGSGAFLITALRYLLDEWNSLRNLRRTALGDIMARDEDTVIRDILTRNIYGVDINPSSVEIAKLALWLHTARGNRPLSSLDEHVREGNSLIGEDFYDSLAAYSPEERERINAFNWEGAFPDVFERGGFDAVIGNPPYVKMQNFRRAHADMAAFLTRPPSAGGRYTSTQTGNFDLFLPFIEKGIALLNDDGRLGYIAPSLWTTNEYGGALRQHITEGKNLYGWVDFGAYQVFEEATTYTALQFYSKTPNDNVFVSTAPDGIIPENALTDENALLSYERLSYGNRWLMTTGPERDLIDRLARDCLTLEDPRLTRGIFVGVQTSADAVYHLVRARPGRYICAPTGDNAPPAYEVEIEDELMKPLVSGSEAKRYVSPAPETFVLFPYRLDDQGATLLSEEQMASDFPRGFEYLRSWEQKLRQRENGAFDDEQWWRFGRNQNLDRQEIEKLIVPRLVSSVGCSVDSRGYYYLDNVDVGGIAAARGVSLYFLAAILNAPTANFVFRRISKPFRGNYRSANKQFIAPLPVPNTTAEVQAEIAAMAEELQGLHTRRRDLLLDIARRFDVVAARAQPIQWLLPDLPTREVALDHAPRHLDAARRREWARSQQELALGARLESITSELRPGVSLDATFERGELRFTADGEPIIERIFLNEEEGNFVLAQWKLLASNFKVTESTTGSRLATALRRVAFTATEPTRSQIITMQTEISRLEQQIHQSEHDLNGRIYVLYGLTQQEIALVESG